MFYKNGESTKQFLYILITFLAMTIADSGLSKSFSLCDMPCCQMESQEVDGSYGSSTCCKSGEVKQCSCKIEFPAGTATQTNPTLPQRSTQPHNIYLCSLPKCILCINPDSNYKFDSISELFYVTSESYIFSGRSPPSV